MTKAYTTIPPGNCECSRCVGTGRVAATDREKDYKKVIAGYDENDDTVRCDNCGGQYMYGTPKGYITALADGTPCLHSYVSSSAGRCLTRYRCACGDSYTIDSGD